MTLVVSACAAAPEGSKPLRFELRQNAVIVPVTVSGQGPFRFLLDTGASRSVIGSRLARRVGKPAPTPTLMMTPAGHSVRDSTSVVLAMAHRAPVEVIATVAADRELDAAVSGIDGIIGQDVLSSAVFTIDYRQQLIYWDFELPSSASSRVPLEFTGQGALLTLPAEPGSTETLRMIPDTGADGVVLFARPGARLPALTPVDIGVLRTLTGHQLVRRVLIDRLDVGPVALIDQEAIVLSATDQTLPPGDGLLPLHIFDRVTINVPSGYVIVSR